MWKVFKFLFLALILFIILVFGYLFLWPVKVQVTAWEVAPMPKAEGILAPNDLLSKAQPFGPALPSKGPEDILIDKEGNFYTGLENGQIIKIDSTGASYEVYANVGGRPLGLSFDKQGNLYVANGLKGLQVVTKEKEVKSLVTEAAGKPVEFAEEVAVTDDGMVYFTQGSTNYTLYEIGYTIIDPSGRLLSYNSKTGDVSELITGIRLANGIALSYNQEYVLINESGTGRILRHWLTGSKKGETSVFIPKMPGLPDNISPPDLNGLFWVALFSDGQLLDMSAKSPFLSQMLLKLPRWFWSNEKATPKNSRIAALNGKGEIVKFLQDGKGIVPNVTCVVEKDGWLYLGSIFGNNIHRVRIN